MLCDQIIFTAADKDPRPKPPLIGRRGYRVTAISYGIKKEVMDFLDTHHYPVGISNLDLLKYHQFKSLLFFKDYAIYTICKNTGIGHDGRDGNLYSHHFVMTKKNFAEIDNDTRFLDLEFKVHHHSTRYLPPITINKFELEQGPLYIPYSEKIIDEFEAGKNVAVFHNGDEPPDIQRLLAELPVEKRAIPWCNMIVQMDRRADFKLFACNNKVLRFRLEEGKDKWKVFEY